MKIITLVKYLTVGLLFQIGMVNAGGINTDSASLTTSCCANTGIAVPINAAPKLDTKQFGLDLHQALKNTGYVMQLQQNGKTIHSQYWGWAKLPRLLPKEEGIPWNPNVPMHIASVSKLITAIGLTKLIYDMSNQYPLSGISFNSLIKDYLPSHWKKGPNINKIRLCHLLTHTSGFNSKLKFGFTTVKFPAKLNYTHMKNMVAIGIANNPVNKYANCGTDLYNYKYENINFSLLRIIMPIMQYSNILQNQSHDQLLDLQTQILHTQYMQDNIFKPAGVTTARTTKTSNMALAYPPYVATTIFNSLDDFSNLAEGFNTGDFTQAIGGAGWHLSVNELLKVMHTFRREGKYMSNQQASKMLDDGFGIDEPLTTYTDAGTLYAKNGGWWDETASTSLNLIEMEQAVVDLLPNNMELVVYVNSSIPPSNMDLQNIVTNAYIRNLK